MNTWLLIAVIGLLFLMVGLIMFIKKFPDNKKTSKSTYLSGIIMPILFAFFFGKTLIGIFPGLTVIDLGAYFLMGVVSGFFLATYFISRKV
jgi:uncharacterized membrane protein HdeD (DUF308 family)